MQRIIPLTALFLLCLSLGTHPLDPITLHAQSGDSSNEGDARPDDQAETSDPADASDPDFTLAQACGDLSAWLHNDRDQLISNALKALRADPAHPYTRELIQRGYDAFTQSGLEGELLNALLAALGASMDSTSFDFTRTQANSRAFTQWVASLSERTHARGLFLESMRALLGVQDWLVTGPFAAHGEDTFAQIMPPEMLVQLDRPMQASHWECEWRSTQERTGKNKLLRGLEDLPDAQQLTTMRGTGCFLLTQIENSTSQALDVELRITSAWGSLRVWLGEEEIITRLPWQNQTSDVAHTISVPAGSTPLLIKLGSDSEARVHLLDPATHMPLPEISTSVPERERFTPYTPARRDLNPLNAPQHAKQIDLEAQPFAASSSAAPDPSAEASDWFQHALNACHFAERRRDQLAADAYAAFLRDERSSSLAGQIWRLRFLRTGAGVLTRAQHRQALREVLQTLSNEYPTAAHLLAEKAELASLEDQLEQAGDALQAMTETDPHWSTRLAAARLYQRIGWPAEAHAQQEWAFSQLPAADAPLDLLLDHAANAMQRRDYALALHLLRAPAATQARFNYRKLSLQLDVSQRLGMVDLASETLEHLAMREGDATRWVRGLIASHADWMGIWQQGYDAYFELARDFPGYAASYLERAADLATAKGDVERATRALQAALELDPSEAASRKALAALKGERYQSVPPQALSVSQLDAESFNAQDFPLASGGLLLDESVLTINADGSYSEYVQRAVKVFTQGGVDRFGSERAEGEIISVSTTTPEGEVLEPVSYSGGQVQFPRVSPGAILHLATTEHYRREDSMRFERYSFLFGEWDSRIPTATARLVIITPKDFALDFHSHGIQAGEYQQSTDAAGRTVHTWEVRRPLSMEDEAYGPSMYELRPWVQFSPKTSKWTSESLRCFEELELPSPTHSIREHAAHLLLNALQSDAFNQHADALTSAMQLESREALNALSLSALRDWSADPKHVPSPHVTYAPFLEACAQVFSNAERARLAYDWINQNIPDESQGTSPESTLALRSGDRAELLVCLMEAMRVEYALVFLGEHDLARSPADAFDRSWEYDDEPLYLIRDPDQIIYLQMEERLAPFGSFNHEWSERPALTLNRFSGKPTHDHLPAIPATHFGEGFIAHIKLQPDGSAICAGSYTRRGYDGWYSAERHERKRTSEQERDLAAALSYMFSGLELLDEEAQAERFPDGMPEAMRAAADTQTLAPTGYARSFVAELPLAARARGKRLSTPLFITPLEEYLSGTYRRDQRKTDVLIRSRISLSDHVEIALPDGFALDEVPESLHIPGDLISYSLSFALTGNTLTISRSVQVKVGRISAASYPAFRKRMLAIESAEDAEIKLRRVGE